MEAKHVTMVGDSGVGKTTLLRQIANETDGVVIWVNDSDEDKVPGYVAGGRKGMFTALEHFDSWSNVRINYQSEKGPQEQIAECWQFAKDIHDSADVCTCIIGDEAHRFNPDDGTGPFETPGKGVLHEGRDDGVKIVYDTQDPQSFDYGPMKQSKYFAWVGPPMGFHDGFLNAHGWIPRDKLPDRNHEYVVMDKQGEIVYRSETKEEYGDGK